jgi:hypothetical protein
MEKTMTDEHIKEAVGLYSSQEDAEFAQKALVNMAGFDADKISLSSEKGKYVVMLEGSPETVDGARTFLHSPVTSESRSSRPIQEAPNEVNHLEEFDSANFPVSELPRQQL